MFKKIKRRIVFHYTLRLYEIQISVSINKILLELSHAHSFVLPMAAFMLQWQHCVVVCDRDWATKPNVFSICPFPGKV